MRSYSWFILFWLNFTIHSSVHWREVLFRFSVRLLDKGKKFIWRILKPNFLPLWNSSRMFIYEKFFLFWMDSAFWQKSRIWRNMIYIQRIFIIITYWSWCLRGPNLHHWRYGLDGSRNWNRVKLIQFHAPLHKQLIKSQKFNIPISIDLFIKTH